YDDEFEDEEQERTELAEELALMICALADVADPLSRRTIMSAFEEGLVDEEVITQDGVEYSYHRVVETVLSPPAADWLSAYRADFRAHLESLDPPPREPRIFIPPPRYGLAQPPELEIEYDPSEPDPPVTAPIRNTGPKVGRNDPCWCGSGRKYKKCHLGQDAPAEPEA